MVLSRVGDQGAAVGVFSRGVLKTVSHAVKLGVGRKGSSLGAMEYGYERSLEQTESQSKSGPCPVPLRFWLDVDSD